MEDSDFPSLRSAVLGAWNLLSTPRPLVFPSWLHLARPDMSGTKLEGEHLPLSLSQEQGSSSLVVL